MKNISCNEKLYLHIRSNLDGFSTHSLKEEGLKQAAVAITIVDVTEDPGVPGIILQGFLKNEAAVILTRRTAGLKHHSGQWALPGGGMDPGELPEETALRELNEEVGLNVTKERIIGHLDDFITRSGFVIKPIVIWGGPGVTLKPNPSEVSSVHRIPIREFMREDAPIIDRIPQSPNPVLHMPVGNSSIASPTGALLYQFREVAILGKNTRVAHYEQPFFAWQ